MVHSVVTVTLMTTRAVTPTTSDFASRREQTRSPRSKSPRRPGNCCSICVRVWRLRGSTRQRSGRRATDEATSSSPDSCGAVLAGRGALRGGRRRPGPPRRRARVDRRPARRHPRIRGPTAPTGGARRLVERGALTVGAVAMPAAGVTYSTMDGPVGPAAAARRTRVVVSRTRRPAPVMELAAALDAELVEMGSAGAKAMAVVRGDVDVYAHAGGQYEWDSAAPVAVARAAGLHVSRIDGSETRLQPGEPWLPIY